MTRAGARLLGPLAASANPPADCLGSGEFGLSGELLTRVRFKKVGEEPPGHHYLPQLNNCVHAVTGACWFFVPRIRLSHRAEGALLLQRVILAFAGHANQVSDLKSLVNESRSSIEFALAPEHGVSFSLNLSVRDLPVDARGAPRRDVASR